VAATTKAKKYEVIFFGYTL